MKEVLDILGNKKTITRQRLLQEHTCYLTGIIEDTEDYLDLFETLKTANAGDMVKIVIDCYGGSVSVGYTIIQHIVEAMENGVDVVASVGKNCASMATVICMYCTDLELFPWSNMLIHSGTENHYGAMNETKKSVEFSFKENEKDLRRDYEFFLTDEEIDRIIDNAEPLLLDSDQIRERWIRKIEMYSGEGGEPQLQLEDLISEIVDKKLAEGKPAKVAAKKPVAKSK